MADAAELAIKAEVHAVLAPYKKEHNGLQVINVPEIENDGQYIAYVDVAKAVKTKMGNVDLAYDSLIAQANKTHKDAIAKKKEYWNPLNDLFTAIQKRLTAFRDKKEQQRQAEERRLRAEAQQAQQAILTEEAAALEQEGRHDEAADVLQEAMIVQAPVIMAPSTLPKVEGTHGRKKPWQFEIIDQEKIRDEYWCPDLDSIAAMVKAKGTLAENLIGKGSIRVWQETSTVIRK